MSSHDVDDITVRGWSAVTVRVAWTLHARGFAVKPEVLRDARDHVWFHLPPDATVIEAEDLAEPLTEAFAERACGRRVRPRFPDDADRILPVRWRNRLHTDLSKNAFWVLRLHLADGHPLSDVAARLDEDVLALEAAREGLREVVRRTAAEDGEDLEDWAEDRLDHLLHRLACLGAQDGPPLLEVVDGLHPDHLRHCLAATRAYHLVRSGELKRADLVPPHGAARPKGRVEVLALHLHPDGKRHLRALARELEAARLPLGDDLLLVDGSDPEPVHEVIRLAAEVGVPRRHHLRGVRIEAPGRWSAHGLLGPGPDDVDARVRSVSWGTVEGLGELPDPLPDPPSARLAWLAVALLGLVTAIVINWALLPEPPILDHPLDVDVVPARSGVWLDFDVDEEAWVAVIRVVDGRPEVLLEASHPADKIALATGDGRYRLHAVGEGVLLASAGHALPDLSSWVDEAASQAAPLDWLAARLRQDDARVDVKVARAE